MDNTMLDYVRAHLPTERTRLLPISEACGVPVGTMEKIARGYTENPRIGTLQVLYDYFKDREKAA